MKKILVALAILVAAATGFYLMTERKETQERLEDSNRRLLTLDERAVTEVRATVDSREWVVIRSDEGDWWIEEPIRDPADVNAVMDLLRVMNQTEVLETIEDPEQLSSYGLDPAVLEIRVGGTRVPLLQVGNETPTGASVFMKLEGRPGVLVAQAEMDGPFLNPDPSRLREQTLAGMPMNEVVRVTIGRGSKPVTLEKEGEHWWITGPHRHRLPASQAVMTGFLETVGNAELVGFVDGADPGGPKFRLGDSALVLGLTGTGMEREIRLGAGTDAGVRVARRTGRDAIMALSGEGLFDLPDQVDAFLDRKVTKANRYKIRWFRYETGGRTLELRRDPEREVWLDTEGGEQEDAAVFSMLVRLLEGRLLEWRAGSGPALPEAVLEYEQDDGVRDRLIFGPDGAVALESVPGVIFTAQVRLPEIPG